MLKKTFPALLLGFAGEGICFSHLSSTGVSPVS